MIPGEQEGGPEKFFLGRVEQRPCIGYGGSHKLGQGENGGRKAYGRKWENKPRREGEDTSPEREWSPNAWVERKVAVQVPRLRVTPVVADFAESAVTLAC
jgi:hypothetical protein